MMKPASVTRNDISSGLLPEEIRFDKMPSNENSTSMIGKRKRREEENHIDESISDDEDLFARIERD